MNSHRSAKSEQSNTQLLMFIDRSVFRDMGSQRKNVLHLTGSSPDGITMLLARSDLQIFKGL